MPCMSHLICNNTTTTGIRSGAGTAYTFNGDHVTGSLVVYVVFCRSSFVHLSFFFWPLNFLSLFDLRILITPLVSSLMLSKCSWLRRNPITVQASGSHKSKFATAYACAIVFEVILFSVRLNYRNKYHITSCHM